MRYLHILFYKIRCASLLSWQLVECCGGAVGVWRRFVLDLEEEVMRLNLYFVVVRGHM
jgi:hypothetical protein